MMIARAWAMPSHNTFSIKPIRELLERYIHGIWCDPFARDSVFANRCIATNDLNPDSNTTHHMEALDFLNLMGACGPVFDGVLFDPPYSPRQITECYQSVGRKTHMQDTQSSFYTHRKRAAHALIKRDGLAICFGWNSNGFGKTMGYELIEMLCVAHGGAHNDTIVTVERKL